MKRVLIIDNYDSFSFNLYQYIGELCGGAQVIKNDDFTCGQIESRFNPTHIVLSPGAGRPSAAGVCELAVKYFKNKAAVLGVCLGHQAICETYGGRITYAKRVMHGRPDRIKIDVNCPIFRGLSEEITVARYHSLAAADLPRELAVTATASDGEIMAVQANDCHIYGVQFHPESQLTPDGKRILKNFLDIEV